MKKEEPHHFTREDFFKALFGAFFVGLTFLFKGSTYSYSSSMSMTNTVLVILFTLLLVTLEIYVLSYKFVKDRQSRPFSEFWAKRFFAITISTFVSLYLAVYLYGLDQIYTSLEIFKLTAAVFLPAATFGAGMEILKN